MGQIDDIRARLEAFDVLIPNGLTDETLEDIDKFSWLAHRMCSKYTDDIRHMISALDAAKAENEELRIAREMTAKVAAKYIMLKVKARDSARRARVSRARWKKAHADQEQANVILARELRQQESELARQRHVIGRLVAAMYQAYAASLAGDDDHARGALWDGVHDNGLTWADGEGGNDEQEM